MASKNKELSDWDRRVIKLARYVSDWSKDPSSKVGAVITTDEGAIALGYNGFPAGIEDDERLSKKNLKNDMIIHAEQNALLIAGSRAKDASLYVWGKPICSRCAVVIIQAGIKKIVATEPKLEKSNKWRLSGNRAVKMFKEVKRNIVYYNPQEFD